MKMYSFLILLYRNSPNEDHNKSLNKRYDHLNDVNNHLNDFDNHHYKALQSQET
jgi:hypothetical protein